MFTTSTILASFILFRGFNTSGAAPAISLLCGFIVIFMGVYLLNLNRLIDPTTQQPRMSLVTGQGVAGTGRLSEHHERLLNGDASGMMNSRMSMSGNNGGSGGRASFSAEAHGLPRRSSIYRNDHHNHGRRESAGSSVLFNAYDNEETVGLTQLNEDSEESDGASSMRSPRTPQSHGRSSSLRLGGKSRGGAGGAGGVGGGGAGGAGANHTRAIGSRDHGNARSTSGSRGRTSLLDGQGHGFAQGMDGEEGETEDHIHPSLAASSRNGRR